MKATVDKVLEKSLITILSIMLLSVVWQVFSRYILKAPSTITDEISSFSLIWVGLLGAAYATGKQLHLAIDLIPEKIVAKNRLFYDGILHLSVFLFSFTVMIIGGIRLCWLTFLFKQTSATLEIPLGYVYLVVPISGLLICYYSIYIFLETRKTSNV
ncbi:TRAP transporter small permease [Flavobacteriaceae bacterium F89]|uniref:TRAP transporter small permease n=1 Tax=Cerina litoralis TaxID=2874477 RepID=A0AAE3JNT1_9FLAO|nr:TRAP transporter small permease [Cerina litoralis]MCG2460246.1 TRAP transporter small permease [Cerina litoralis]